MELSLNKDSSAALRDFASSMPVAIKNIVEATESLFQIYQSHADMLGEHSNDFYDLLTHIKAAQDDAAEAVLALPPMMEKTADAIDAYLAIHPSIS